MSATPALHRRRLPAACCCPCAAGECEALEGELQAAKASLAELQGERDELATQLGTTEAELQNVQDCLEGARWAGAGRGAGRQEGGCGWLAGWLALVRCWAGCALLFVAPSTPASMDTSSNPLPSARCACPPACCRADLASKEEAMATLTSEKAELEARHNELRWGGRAGWIARAVSLTVQQSAWLMARSQRSKGCVVAGDAWMCAWV